MQQSNENGQIYKMKTFKQFLENYDVYLDKPMGFKNTEDTEPAEEETDESVAQEENANEVKK